MKTNTQPFSAARRSETIEFAFSLLSLPSQALANH